MEITARELTHSYTHTHVHTHSNQLPPGAAPTLVYSQKKQHIIRFGVCECVFVCLQTFIQRDSLSTFGKKKKKDEASE